MISGARHLLCYAVMKPKVALLVFALAGVCFGSAGMDRWAALSQIESGDNDSAVGKKGEISRYQILPDVWAAFAPDDANWQNAKVALTVAKEAMKKRCAEFEQTFHRAPTDFEFYVLWNAPAQIQQPGSVVKERATRFCNLLSKKEELVSTPKP
jgi:hypothetical protein